MKTTILNKMTNNATFNAIRTNLNNTIDTFKNTNTTKENNMKTNNTTTNNTLLRKIINGTSEFITDFKTSYTDIILSGLIKAEKVVRMITGKDNEVDNILIYIAFNFVISTLVYEFILSFFGLSGYGLLFMYITSMTHLFILRDNIETVEAN